MENKIFAGVRLRLLASYVDLAILALPITFLLWYAGASLNIPTLVQRLFLSLIIWILVFILINLLHDIFFTHYFGGPIGKLLTGLRVVDENGNKLTLKRSFFRHTVGYQFSGILFGLGFLAIIKDPQKQGWHDKAVGSKVIVERKNWPIALFVLLTLIILNLYILYSAFTTAFSGPLPKEFQSLVNSYQTKQEKTKPSTDSKDLTANWQTYRNEKLGFELKYPDHFMQWEEYPSETLPRRISFHRSTISGFELEGLKITVSDRGEYEQYYQGKDPIKTLEDYVAELIQAHRNSVSVKENKRVAINKVRMGEKDAVKIIYGDGKTLIFVATEPDIYIGPIQYIVLNNGKFYTIEFYTNNDELIELFNQILSTFRFTEVSRGVTVTTDKTEYIRGETVMITIENRTETEKWIMPYRYWVERFDNNIWVQVPRVTCPCGYLCNAPPGLKLQSGAQEQFEWSQEESFCDNFKEVSRKPATGRYRVGTSISNVGDTQEEKMYSREFVIK